MILSNIDSVISHIEEYCLVEHLREELSSFKTYKKCTPYQEEKLIFKKLIKSVKALLEYYNDGVIE